MSYNELHGRTMSLDEIEQQK